jgi:hypothetical protein
MWMIALTALIVVFTFLTWHTYKTIEFLTGAMESHGTIQLRLEILKWNDTHPDNQIKMTWWDRTKADTPTEGALAHGQPVTMNEVYFMLPLGKREGQASLCRDARTSLQALCRYTTARCRWPKE